MSGVAVALSSLPTDLIRVVCEFVPLRPRILVLSILSKRFRAICLKCEAHLWTMSLARTNAALHVLKNVVGMETFHPAQRVVPSTLKVVSSFNALNSVKVAPGREFEDTLQKILEKLPSSLLSLTYFGEPSSFSHFTALTELHLDYSYARSFPESLKLVFLHLRSLSIPAGVPPAWLESSTFPSVQHLDAHVCASDMAPLMRIFPSLTSIVTFISGFRRPECNLALTGQLRHLVLQLTSVDLKPDDALYSLPRLLSLTVPGTINCDFHRLRQLTQLKFHMDAWDGAICVMPHLRALELNHWRPAIIGSLLPNCPVLQDLSLFISDCNTDERVNQLFTTIDLVARNSGVGMLTLRGECKVTSMPRDRSYTWLCVRFQTVSDPWEGIDALANKLPSEKSGAHSRIVPANKVTDSRARAEFSP